MVDRFKVRIKDFPVIRRNILEIKEIIKDKGANVVFKPLPHEFGGRFGVSRMIKGQVVRMWLPKKEMQICCYDVDGKEVQIYSYLDRSDFQAQPIARVKEITSIPRRKTPVVTGYQQTKLPKLGSKGSGWHKEPVSHSYARKNGHAPARYRGR